MAISLSTWSTRKYTKNLWTHYLQLSHQPYKKDALICCIDDLEKFKSNVKSEKLQDLHLLTLDVITPSKSQLSS